MSYDSSLQLRDRPVEPPTMLFLIRPATVRNAILLMGAVAAGAAAWLTRSPTLPDRYDELLLHVAGMH
jgi:hypothetical protein